MLIGLKTLECQRTHSCMCVIISGKECYLDEKLYQWNRELHALTLWFLSTGADSCTTGHLFGVSKAAVCVITKQVCNALQGRSQDFRKGGQ